MIKLNVLEKKTNFNAAYDAITTNLESVNELSGKIKLK